MTCKYCNDTGFVYDNIWKKCLKCNKNFISKFKMGGIDKKSYDMKFKDFRNNKIKKQVYDILKSKLKDNSYIMMTNDEVELMRYCDYIAMYMIKRNIRTKILFIEDIFDVYFKDTKKYKNFLKIEGLCILLGTEYLKSDTTMLINFIYKFLLIRERMNTKTFLFYSKSNNSVDNYFEINKRYGNKISRLIFKSNMFKVVSGE